MPEKGKELEGLLHSHLKEINAQIPDLLSGSAIPTGPASGQYRVIRGGSWVNTADYCRSATRFGGKLSYSVNGLGFRVCLSPSGK